MNDKINISRALVGAVMGGIVGAAGAYFVLSKQIHEIEERIALTPPIAVVDFVAMADQYPGGASAEAIDEMLTTSFTAIDKLTQAGYIVLSAEDVVSAPAELYLTSEVLGQ